ncbi:MAG: hypothetical protein RIF33_20280 [Cyclobacteriaceae bacterium]
MNHSKSTIWILVAFVQLCFMIQASAQSLTGLWEMKEVKVGDKIMTPVAKWTTIKENGTYTSGNGWLQNSEGLWRYDNTTNVYTPTETNGIKDPFGGFDVSFESSDRMTWQRIEEGMTVTVLLERIDKLPKSTADHLQGLWDLADYKTNGVSNMATFDPEDKHYIFIRWDRVYVERTPQGDRATGYWHIHGHKPEITLLSHNPEQAPQSWRVEFNNGQLTLVGISDTNTDVECIYSRLDEFPQ